ncbi:MAG: hypothetical protein D6681_13410 [Calditrichaeota bacterium]|nr:MAG: hypothetical protein D6681_13410 [Calditrichota bacterium]
MWVSFLPAQSVSRNASAARRELARIRAEIQQLQTELETSERRLRTHSEALKNIEQQITLQRQAMRLLQQEIRRNRVRIAALQSEIDTLGAQIARLRKVYRSQVLFLYKYQPVSELEWVLGAKSFNEALLRYRYFRILSESLRGSYRRLRNKRETRLALQDELARKLADQERLARERLAEQKALEAKREERRQLIEEITRNRKLLQAAIREKEESYRQLKALIGSLQNRRARQQLAPEIEQRWDRIEGNFADQRGRLNWPVQGSVVHPFGKYRNPKLKTVLINNGIDIKARKGTEVRVVFPGVVSVVTYMAGFGNTIIVDHNNGYFTVYSHLDEVLVKKYQFVEAGATIGTVGESGSLEGPMLHFEIYGDNRPLNPLRWLRKAL